MVLCCTLVGIFEYSLEFGTKKVERDSNESSSVLINDRL